MLLTKGTPASICKSRFYSLTYLPTRAFARLPRQRRLDPLNRVEQRMALDHVAVGTQGTSALQRRRSRYPASLNDRPRTAATFDPNKLDRCFDATQHRCFFEPLPIRQHRFRFGVFGHGF
jgi:hypothetical protein